MNPHAARAVEVESAFLAGAEANLDRARGSAIEGSKWEWTTLSQEERIRALMGAHGQCDRSILRSYPKNRSRILTGRQERLFFGARRVSVAIAACLSPLEHYFTSESEPPPVGLGELASHVRSLVGEADVHHLIGVCSTSGFTEEARRSRLEPRNVTIVLVEARSDGGWTVTALSPSATACHCELFDPEPMPGKLERVAREVRGRGAELLAGGLSAAEVGARLGVSAEVVAAAFERMISLDQELRLSRHGADVVLWRSGAAAMEVEDMSMIERVRQLFSGEGNLSRKISTLSERRVQLVQRRDRLYADIAQIEKREASLLQEGRGIASLSAKRRVASQIKQLRDDMGRIGTTARMVGQQVDVISTHIHNLTLIQQGKSAKLPPTEEITRDAVRAEEMLEQLGADAEMVSSLSSGMAQASTSDEEMAILKELEAPPATAPPVFDDGLRAAPEPSAGKMSESREPEPE